LDYEEETLRRMDEAYHPSIDATSNIEGGGSRQHQPPPLMRLNNQSVISGSIRGGGASSYRQSERRSGFKVNPSEAGSFSFE
jgi:hypothetical protein